MKESSPPAADPDPDRTLHPRDPPTADSVTLPPSADTATGPASDGDPGDGLAPGYGSDRYEDLGLIARGGQGEVRRVRDHKMDRVLALKLLRPLASASARRRFLVETAITVQLQHPGIVPVYDRGVTADGRPWYTMKEVEGRVFAEHIADAHATRPGAWTARQLLDAFSRICEAVAYAHEHGVVHRDLKPHNVMIGRFGEVLVMDWGLARRVTDAVEDTDVEVEPYAHSSHTAVGTVLGTPAYMAPEQAAGDLDAIAPTTDAYALGVLLYELLAGARPFTGGFADIRAALLSRDGPAPSVGPEPLRALCARALKRDPAARPADAGVLAREVALWLAGARQREQARALVDEAAALLPRARALREEATALARRAAAILDPLSPSAPVDAKRPGWTLADAARARRREARLTEVRLREHLRSALELDPDSADARAALTAHYRAQLLEAEAAGDADRSAEWVTLLEAHDPVGSAAWLRGDGRLTLRTDPPGAHVELLRTVERDRRLVEVATESLGVTPIEGAPIAMGRYVAVLTAPGRATVRYPIHITRGGDWHGRPPGAETARAITLPPSGAIGPDERYVPAGWFIWGDPDAQDGLPRARLWVDAFVIAFAPVTHRAYLEWCDALAEAGDPTLEAAMARRSEGRPLYHRAADGRHAIADVPGHAPALDHPVTGVTPAAARRYCAWRAERDGLPWRLPTSWEWEKAARGVDGRVYPWGETFEVTYADVLHCRPGPPEFSVAGACPTDESPYGVRDLAGNVREICADVYRPSGPHIVDGRAALGAAPTAGDFLTVKGGCIISGDQPARTGSRAGLPLDAWVSMGGFRLCRSLT